HPTSLFFFSSRRRHTRWPRDWSSDVCSSDLASTEMSQFQAVNGRPFDERLHILRVQGKGNFTTLILPHAKGDVPNSQITQSGGRSEERRVGKECRSRRSP